jgi:dipeptidyl aminopeptidase/acylaminoacyl peptidase
MVSGNAHRGCIAALAAAALAVFPCSRLGAAPQAGFTLAQVLSAPFPAGLTAAAAGGRVAWIFNDHGARNVWIAARGADGHFAGHAVTDARGDDGSDAGDLSWSPSGRYALYTRGGSFEGGPPVNPLSLPSGPPEQAVWMIDAQTGQQHRVGAGHAAVASPKDDAVAFISGGQIWTAPAQGGQAAQRVHDRGDDTSLTWSPDGAKLAFVSTRAGHSIVGVLNLPGDRITWMAPSFDSDIAPEWSPDGRRLAFVRIPAGEGEVDFTPHRSGQPWSIWVCDAATGVGNAVWVASPGPGSLFHGTLGYRALMWAAGDRLVFPWERTGWVHLYAIPASGGQPSELTTGGAFEVFNTSLSADRTHIAYSANRGDIDRWHVWEVPVAGGPATQLTQGDGIEDYPVLASDNTLLALHSDARTPVRPVQVQPSGPGAAPNTLIDIAPGTIPPDFPADKLVQPQLVTFPAADGLLVHGQLFMPAPAGAQRHPAVLFFHGGPYRQMFAAWHTMDAYSWMYGFNQFLASQGYIVLSVNYRGGIGYGLNFREPPKFGAAGASEFNDIRGAGDWLRRRNDVDAARIGIWGGSYGGLMTALGLARAPDLFAVGVDYAGVHDWRSESSNFSGPAAQLAYDSSAIATMDHWRAPVLVAHNDDDREVVFSQSIELVQALRQRNIPFEQLVLPDEGHVMLRAQSWLNFFDKAQAYLAAHLMSDVAK